MRVLFVFHGGTNKWWSSHLRTPSECIRTVSMATWPPQSDIDAVSEAVSTEFRCCFLNWPHNETDAFYCIWLTFLLYEYVIVYMIWCTWSCCQWWWTDGWWVSLTLKFCMIMWMWRIRREPSRAAANNKHSYISSWYRWHYKSSVLKYMSSTWRYH